MRFTKTPVSGRCCACAGVAMLLGLAAALLGSGAQDAPPTSASPSPGLPAAATQPTAPDDALAPLGRGIVGSKHDFSDGGRVPRDLCTPCHTPHITASQAPLLVNRGGRRDPTRSYQTRAGELDAASLVCLSCHDGSIARDVYAGAHATSWADRSGGDLPPGRSRLTNHPVGVSYPDGEAGYNSSAAVTSAGKIKLPGGRIQCTTCHDPHNTQGVAKMLVISNERSRLCLSCHRL